MPIVKPFTAARLADRIYTVADPLTTSNQTNFL